MEGECAGSSRKRRYSDEYVNLDYITVSELDRLLSDSEEEAELSENDDIVSNKSLLSDSDDDSDGENGDISRDVSLESNNFCENSPSWNDDENNLNIFDFTKTNELLVSLPGNSEPYNYFNILLDELFLEKVCEMSNMYAQQAYGNSENKKHARINKWRDLSVDELKVFLGLILHTGILSLPRLQDYWKTDPLLKTVFPNYMSRDRFLLILRYLHFCKNPEANEEVPEDRLYKIRMVLDYFNNKMIQTYYPGRELSLDEAMVLWRGRLIFRQYIKGKKHKYGIKIYTLCEPNGLVLKTLVYAGKLDELAGKGHSTNVVLQLMKEKLNVGHSLYMDNFYNSYELSKKLLEQKTYSTGTLQATRKNTPLSIVKAKLKKGETISQYSDSGIMIAKWRDKRDVLYISTQYENEMVNFINKKGITLRKPLPVVQYNCYMSGVDRKDQMLSYYPCERKTVRWYKKLFFHFLQIILLNSYLLYSKYSTATKMSFLDFRFSIIKHLLKSTQQPRKTQLVKPTMSPTGNTIHLPTKCEKGARGKILRKKCRLCITRGKRTDTSYICTACPGLPALCLNHCFEAYHK